MIKFDFNICWKTCLLDKTFSTQKTCNIAYLRTNYKMSIYVMAILCKHRRRYLAQKRFILGF